LERKNPREGGTSLARGARSKMSRKTIFPLLVLCITRAWAQDSDVARLTESEQVVKEIMAADDKAIPGSLFQKSYCAVVIPSMKKAGFVFSAKYGRGFVSCRTQSGGWSAPAGLRVEGGGFGLQIGGSETDIIMLVMSQKGMQGMLASKFTLGGEVSAAAGPVGRDITAQTDATMRADILSWSRSRGVFGGISLQGGTLRPDNSVNEALYKTKQENKDILTGKVKPTKETEGFLKILTTYGGAQQKK
jgi:SH3 domain-containing YSC84-like protein 1